MTPYYYPVRLRLIPRPGKIVFAPFNVFTNPRYIPFISKKNPAKVPKFVLENSNRKLKKEQNDLLKSQTKKRQDKLLINVACDHGDARVPPGQYLGSMWNYLRKYKNNHAKNSLLPETRSNASTDARIWESGPATLNPLTGTVIDSPWATTSSNTNFPHMMRKKRH